MTARLFLWKKYILHSKKTQQTFEANLNFLSELNKLNIVYLEIPKFTKTLSELTTDYDRWLYLFKNLHKLGACPEELEQGIFKILFDLAEIKKLNTM